ncbi:MAG: linalool dehydratase/isomerase domain-containing protein, partial [Candidatus Kariarchaeaceae archaeon]
MNNKLFTIILLLNLLVTSSTFLFSPKTYPNPKLHTIDIPGKGTFDLNLYPVLDRRVIGLLNSIRDFYQVTDMSNQSLNDLSMLPDILTQYFLAFSIYGISEVVDATPNYRTDYYKDIFHKLIGMMNSSQMEQQAWVDHGWADEYYAPQGNGFRGPTNIMWTAHYSLMQLFYYSLFRESTYLNETQYYLEDWNNSLTAETTWDGKPSNGLGKWGVGLIPCEPYIVFIQCNSIPFYVMRVYDQIFGTDYQAASLPGTQWWQDNMVDDRGITVDGYFIAEPNENDKENRTDLPDSYPNLALTEGTSYPKVSSYGTSWAIMLYNGMGMEELADRYYGPWKNEFVHYTTEDMAYVPNNYHLPSEFGIFEVVGNLFAYFSTHELGDDKLFNKLENWFYEPFPGEWDGYNYGFDTSVLGEDGKFVTPIVNFGWVLGH